MASADIAYTFGADAAGLEAAIALAKANVNAYAADLRALAKEMKATGASADSELGEKMKSLGAGLTASKAQMAAFNNELKSMEPNHRRGRRNAPRNCRGSRGELEWLQTGPRHGGGLPQK